MNFLISFLIDTFIRRSVTYSPSCLKLFLAQSYGKFSEKIKNFLDHPGSREIHVQTFMSDAIMIFCNGFHWKLWSSLPLSRYWNLIFWNLSEKHWSHVLRRVAHSQKCCFAWASQQWEQRRVGDIGSWLPIISNQITIMSDRRSYFPVFADHDREWL